MTGAQNIHTVALELFGETSHAHCPSSRCDRDLGLLTVLAHLLSVVRTRCTTPVRGFWSRLATVAVRPLAVSLLPSNFADGLGSGLIRCEAFTDQGGEALLHD